MTSILSRKLKFEKNIKKLDDTQMYEIYRLLEENAYPLTRNTNGIFFNLLPMDTELFSLLENYLNYSIQKNDILRKDEKKIEKLTYEFNNK
jgi:hypothetical protein